MNSHHKHPLKWILGFLIFSLSLLYQPLWAHSCNIKQIDQLLQRGFNHDQVITLCGKQNSTPTPKKSEQKPEPPTKPSPQTVAASPGAIVDKDSFYLQTVIDADKIEISAEAITYWRDKCYPYGTEGFTGFRPEACVNLRTSILREGLKVVRATKGVLLIRDQELIVSGNIKQEVLNPEKLKPKELKRFSTDYPTSPKEINIPIKKGINPVNVAKTLKRLGIE